MPLDEGMPAPEISAPNQYGDTRTVTGEDPTVLYFYPRDNTPGCTTEANQFTEEIETYREAGVEIYGVSTDTVESHERFAEAQDIEFDLLADPDGQVADAYDVDRNPSGSTQRTTFVIVDGSIHTVYTNVSPDGHAREVMMDLLDDDIVELEI